MKKFCTVFLAILLSASCAFAAVPDIDLAALTFDELVELKLMVETEMITRDEMKEVEVPPGTYEVGVHIPAGEYTLVATQKSSTYFYLYADKSTMDSNRTYEYHILGRGETAARVVVEEGLYIKIESGPCIFSPFIGLGF